MGLVKGLSFRDGMTGLVNRITGMGTNRDAATATQFVFQRPSSSTLEALYRANWIARKIVNIPIDDMLREGWHWQADDPLITKLEAEENRLQVRDHLRRALIRDAVYGGAALYLGTDDPDVSQELRLDRMRKGSLRYLTPFHASDLQVVALDHDPERLGQPTMFRMTKHDGSELLIHPSRIIDFCSRPVDRAMSQWNVDDFWGDSRLSCVMADIAAAGSSMAGASRLMGELAVWVYKINGLSETLAMAGGEDRVQALLNLTNTMKSSINALAVDSEDTAEIITASLAGVPETIRTFLQNVAGAADIPYTRFMGASPDGMNATGASDARNYYDRLAGERENYVVPPMARLDQVLIRSALGDWDDNVYRVWDPLWQLSETEQVDLDVKKMEMLGKMQERGLVHDHVIEQVSRVTMIESPNFPGAEEAFEEAENMPDARDEAVEEATSVQEPPQRQKPNLRIVDEAGIDVEGLMRINVADDGTSTITVISDKFNESAVKRHPKGSSIVEMTLEDIKAWMSQPRHPAGTSKGGQWSGGPSQSLYGPQMQGSSSPSGTGINYDSLMLSDNWEDHGSNPAVKHFTANGVSPRQLIEAISPHGVMGDNATASIVVKNKTLIVRAKSDKVDVHRIFYMDGQDLVARHETFKIDASLQGNGVGTQTLSRSMDLYEKAGVARVDLDAGLSAGGYVWAKFGFLPSDEDALARLKSEARANLKIRDPSAFKEMTRDGGPLDLYSISSKIAWQIADHSSGKNALTGVSWSGSLHLNDSEAMARFNKYTKRK